MKVVSTVASSIGKGLVAVSCRRLPDGTAAYYFGSVDDA